MRVLHVTSTFPRTAGDPTGQFVADLIAAEQAAGIDTRVVAPWASGVADEPSVRRFHYGADSLAYRGGLLAAARSPRGAAMVPAYLAAMGAAARREARRWGADIVHAHWWFPGGLVSLPAGRPLVVTLHGSDVALASRLGPLARMVARRAAAVLAVSPSLAASAALGVPVDVARMPVIACASRVPREPGPHRLVAAGRLTPEKGFDVLVQAVRGLDVTVDLCGDGPMRSSLRSPNVHQHGTVPRHALHDLMARADAVVVPSRREGLGLVAVEAILVGTPVIASDTGGLPGVLAGDGGVLVPPDDVSALRAAILAVGSLAVPGPASRAAAALHDPAVVAARHVDLYTSVLAD